MSSSRAAARSCPRSAGSSSTASAKIASAPAASSSTPNVTVAEWWRGRTDRRDEVWKGLLIEPPSDETVKLAGLALAKVRGATAVDAIVAAFAAQRTGIVYTGDMNDFDGLSAFFPGLRVFAI